LLLTRRYCLNLGKQDKEKKVLQWESKFHYAWHGLSLFTRFESIVNATFQLWFEQKFDDSS
jgi:hypothetical protein